MGRQVQVFHLEKRMTVSSGLNRHITRIQFEHQPDGTITREVWIPANADINKTAGNVELISREYMDSEGEVHNMTIQQAINRRLQEAKIKTTNRKRNTCLEMVFSGSRETMCAMDRETLMAWTHDSVAWAQETFGKENVVSATLHVDEMTPHIHLIAVPIVTGESRRTISKRNKKIAEGKTPRRYNIDHNKLRLSADQLYTREKLYEYHDSYSKKVSCKYGLERGVKAEPGCQKSHQESIDYNRELNKIRLEQEKILKEITSDYNEKSAKSQELEETIRLQKSRVEASKNVRMAAVESEIAKKHDELKKAAKVKIWLEGEMQKIRSENIREKAELEKLKEQLNIKVKSIDIPKKNILGLYKPEEVEKFIDKALAESMIKRIDACQRNNAEIDEESRKNIKELDEIKKIFYTLYNDPEQLEKRAKELRQHKDIQYAKSIIDYILAANIKIESLEKCQEYDGLYYYVKAKKNERHIFVCINPDESLNYTNELDVVDALSAKANFRKQIWYETKSLAEVKQDRAKTESKNKGIKR